MTQRKGNKILLQHILSVFASFDPISNLVILLTLIAIAEMFYFIVIMFLDWHVQNVSLFILLILCELIFITVFFLIIKASFPRRRVYHGLLQLLILIMLVMYLGFDFPISAISFLILPTAAIFILFYVVVPKRYIPFKRRLIISIASFSIYFLIFTYLMIQHSIYAILTKDCPYPEYNVCLKQSDRYEINDKGYRSCDDKNVSINQFPRMLFLGDSSTFGTFVHCEETYSTVVGHLLRNAGYPAARSINGGVLGYDLLEIVPRYNEFRSLKPHYVFIMSGLHYQKLPSRLHSILNRKRDRYANWDMESSFAFQLHTRHPIADDSTQEQLIGIWKNGMKIFSAEIRQDGATPVLLIYPTTLLDPRIIAAQRELSEQEQIPLIDLLQVFQTNNGKWQTIDQVHPTIAGHRLMAETIADWIIRHQKMGANNE